MASVKAMADKAGTVYGYRVTVFLGRVDGKTINSPAKTVRIPEELKGKPGLYESCAIITDGRFSGGTSGLSVGYVSPEAALGSPLAVVQNGDEIEIDVPNRKMDLLISEEEMADRISKFSWEFPGKEYHRYLRMFVKTIGSMAKGGIWEV